MKMEAKVFIFVVFATVAQSSSALGEKNSCTVSNVKIKDDLATVNYGEDTATLGLDRVVEIVYRSMFEIYHETYGTETGTEHTSSAYSQEIRRSETKSRNTSFTDSIIEAYEAAMIGIVPILEAQRVIRPDSEITPGQNRARALLQRIIESFYYAIGLTESKNYSKSRAQIEVYENKAVLGGRTLVDSFFIGVLNGTNYPPETQASLACFQRSVESKIVGAFRNIFYAIKLLHNQLATGSRAGSEDCLLAMKVAQAESAYLLESEVKQKYGVIRVLVIANHLEKHGIIDGLLALQSVDMNI